MMHRGESGDEMVSSDSIMVVDALSLPDQCIQIAGDPIVSRDRVFRIRVAAHSESKSCRPSAHVRHANNSESNIIFTESTARLKADVEQQDEVWGLDHPRYVSVPGVRWRVGVTILSLLIEACSFMLCDLDFEPLSLSLSSMPSCDLESLTNILILCLILKASNQSLRKSLSLNLELS
ncbi:hypothetical protein Tco_0718500 [Tanacetum coccineum]